MRATDPKIIPASITSIEIAALLAVRDEKATPSQAKLAMDWVMREACRINDMAFQLGGEDGRRASDFASGRQWPGFLIRAAMMPETFKRAEETRGVTVLPLPPKRQTP